MSKDELLNKIATYTGGRAAEELVFHSVTTGASNDIEPVSYTHLDVYKRQVWTSAPLSWYDNVR